MNTSKEAELTTRILLEYERKYPNKTNRILALCAELAIEKTRNKDIELIVERLQTFVYIGEKGGL
jgi:hypothetical protein